ncbi:MAG TPA: hypothetical protein VNZ52_08535 [Candidatus Thermoplasmatota archaeon]|nr:hypothetical protein [Candidatus Thermoplasmatota archaeon]
MNYRTLAAVLGALMALAPLAAATHSTDSPPDGTLKTVGGAWAVTTLNLAPQELDAKGQPTSAAGPAGQRLVSTGTYNCATGIPGSGAGTGKISLDVVALNDYGLTLTADDHAVDTTMKETEGEETNPSDVRYGAEVFVGYGAVQPAMLYPGILFFYAYVLCDGNIMKELPPAVPGQTQGLFGWIDENRFTNGTDNPYAPEFTFEYLESSSDTAGAVGPGEIVGTPGWYLEGGLQWDANSNLQTNTFRFALNPSLTDQYPGYTGSQVQSVKRYCLTDDTPNDDPEHGGLLGYCSNTGFIYYEFFFNPVPAPATVAKPAAVVEDVDIYYMADKAALGVDLLEPAMMEAKAVGAYAQDGAIALLDAVNPTGAQEIGEAVGPDYGNGWRPILNVVHYTGVASAGLRVDPLFNSGFNSNRNAYPLATSFDAYMGLGKDTNGDGIIDPFDTNEWFGIDDALHLAVGDQLLNWGDIGYNVDGNQVVTDGPAVFVSYCNFEATPYNAGDLIPVQDPDVANCGAVDGKNRPMHDAANGWGTFPGDASNDAETHGRYGGNSEFYTAAGSSSSSWTMTVKARIIWPASASVFAAAQLAVPAGVNIPYGTITYLKDVDTFGPALG